MLLGLGLGGLPTIGGRVEELKTPAQAAVRELLEESGLTVSPADLRDAGSLEFRFAGKAIWDMIADLFVTHHWSGTALETIEIAPIWWDMDALPWAQMWPDGRHWLLECLGGALIEALCVYAADGQTVQRFVSHELE